MIILKEVNEKNFWDVIDLKVKDEQKDFVTSNAVSLGQAYVQKELIPLAIYNDETLVGFIMYCIDKEDNEYWIYRLMIDEKYQGKGYSKLALNEILVKIKADKKHHKIFLGLHIDSTNALNLYKNLGFKFDGRVFGSEHIMILEY